MIKTFTIFNFCLPQGVASTRIYAASLLRCCMRYLVICSDLTITVNIIFSSTAIKSQRRFSITCVNFRSEIGHRSVCSGINPQVCHVNISTNTSYSILWYTEYLNTKCILLSTDLTWKVMCYLPVTFSMLLKITSIQIQALENKCALLHIESMGCCINNRLYSFGN